MHMKYITTKQASENWNISQRRVAVLCVQNRICGAIKAGKTWLIPSTCDKPEDERSSKKYKYKIDSGKNDGCYIDEPQRSYFVKTELMLDSKIIQNAKRYFIKKGKTLSEGISDYLKSLTSDDNNDFRDSYKDGFFSLFGCAPDIEVSENDLTAEEIEL